jgi:hypothetical protein
MHLRRLFTIALLLALGAGSARATEVAERSLRQLTADAPTIVHGTVVGNQSHWTDNHSLIVTDVRVQVMDVLKGKPASEVVFTLPGGTVGAIRVEADGAAPFRVGDEAVLFLDRSPRGVTHLVGLMQGRFDVVTDTHGRKSVRGLTAESLGTLRRTMTRMGSAPIRDTGGPVPLDSFLGGLRDLVRDVQNEGGR